MLRARSIASLFAIFALLAVTVSGCGGSVPPPQLRASGSPQQTRSETPSSEPRRDGFADEGAAPLRSEEETAHHSRDRAAEAEAEADSAYSRRMPTPGLGTTWGEQRSSRVREVSFVRDAGSSPLESVTFHYNDEDHIEAASGRSARAAFPGVVAINGGALEVSLVDSDDDPLPLLTANGHHYVIGEHGDRYVIRIQNHTAGRFEVVTSIDGLDALDGSAAGYHKRGYLVEPWGTLHIEGFRESDEAVRAFRFGSLQDSYAARRGQGRNVGVVGVALFGEQGFVWGRDDREEWRWDTARPFPGKYAPPPEY